MENTTLTIIISLLTAIGVTGGLIFNGLMTRNHNKNQHYQILKELQDEFNKIDSMDQKSNGYKVHFVNFHEKIAHLGLNRIIPNEVISYFDGTFPRALLMIKSELVQDATTISKVPNLILWCKINNFQPARGL